MKISFKALLLVVSYFATARSLVPGKLVELEYSQRVVQGKYESEDGISGITFFSQEDDYLLINTFDGKTLIDTGPFIDVDGWKVRSVYVLGLEYLQYTSPDRPDEPVDHDHSFSEAIEKLLEVKEVDLLPEAAEAIGQRGLTGRNTPAVLPFFMFALRITQLYLSSSVSITNTTYRQVRDDCRQDCPPCEDNGCPGMCGINCHCWDMVCDDCCWHQGCFDVRNCCANVKGKRRSKCFTPDNFRCDQPYYC
ncbi:uncharacterized protein [Dysidea avara]|uniref:uncharacterized protein n=1 Tax=Dysidea avara TaxID=196820 RepID=UPI00331E7B3C